MAAYAIADVEVTDPARFQEYRSQAHATVEQYGGKFIVGGGAIEKVEGNWDPSLMVIIEFESMQQLKKWWHSPQYSSLIQSRQQSANTNVLFVEGV